MKNERKVTVKFVEAQKPLDMSLIAQAIADVIRREGVNNNERRAKIS